MTVGKALAEARQAAGLSMPELAMLLGTVRQTVWQVETGRKPFPLGWLPFLPEGMRPIVAEALFEAAKEKIERAMGQ